MLAELKEYYKSKGISAVDFNCPHFPECSRFSEETFTTAKEAFISSGYAAHELPRIVFLSLDSGSADQDPAKKTMEAIQQQEEIIQNVNTLPKNKHWYRTHELAYRLLRHFKEGLAIEEVKHYFAHTNSAKCCMNNPGRAQANSILFRNCQEFIPGEIEILSPDILITQGAYAYQAVNYKFMELETQTFFTNPKGLPEEIKVIQIGNHSVFWIHTFHPRHPESKKNRDNYSNYEVYAFEFINHTTYSLESKTIEKRSVNIMVSHRETSSNGYREKYGNYIFLDVEPETPSKESLKRRDYNDFDYMTMVQLCNIAQNHGISRTKACNAFGGDKGKYEVEPNRMSRAHILGKKLKKYVLVSAAIDYFAEEGINW